MASFLAKLAAEVASCSLEKAEKLGHIAGVLADGAGVLADRALRRHTENEDYVQVCPDLMDMPHCDSDGDEQEELERIDSEGHHKLVLADIQNFLKLAMEAYKDTSLQYELPAFVERSQLIRDLKEPTKLKWGITTDTEVHVCVLKDGTLAFAFRGSELRCFFDRKSFLGDTATDFKHDQVPLEHYDASNNVSYKACSSVKVHEGFQLAFQDVTKTHRPNENLRIVAEGLGLKKEDVKQVVCVGHSLGGALATLCAHWCRYVAYPKAEIWCVTIGSPRVGNRAFADDFNVNVTKGRCSYRVVNKGDMVPLIPYLCHPKIWSAYKHVEGSIYLSEDPTSKDTILLKRGGRRPNTMKPSLIDHRCKAYFKSIDKVLASSAAQD